MLNVEDMTMSSTSNLLLQGLACIGLMYCLTKGVSYLRLILSVFVLSGRSLRKFGPKGSWAVVTGASDGIGKEFAIQLAHKGFNIVLLSRTDSKLKQLAREIETKYAATVVETKTLAIDFAKATDQDYAHLKTLVDGLDVAILVNNVGKSHDMPVPFILTSRQEMTDIITINCLATLRVTRIIAPAMVQRGRGLILTMGSFGGLLPTPLLATYSGSKAFLQQWSSALGAELRPHGIDVELVLSYLVTSAMSKIRRTTMLIPNPRNFVRAVLANVGRSGGAQGIAFTSTPYWTHALLHWALTTFTGTTNRVVVGQNKAMHENIRQRALKKLEKDARKAL